MRMFRIRLVPVVLSLLLIGAGCALRPTSDVPPAPEERTARESAPAPTSTPEAPPAAEAAVSALPPLTDWPTWSGTWFDVKYPPGFTARAGATGCIEGAGCDSAYFLSPDGKVEFYVMSPLWGADAAPDLALRSTERLVNEKTQVSEQEPPGRGPLTTHWVTIAAKDGSYTRSWVDIKDENSGSWVNHTFGIRYADAAGYAGWRDAYLAFKGSLVQYAD